jgi:hypothetical protein
LSLACSCYSDDDGGGGGWQVIDATFMVTVMATTMIAMINPCSFYQSNGTTAVTIYFYFYIR